MSVGILVDVTKCRGCERCVEACVRANGLDPAAADSDRAISFDGLSANRLCTVRAIGEGRNARIACMHCEEPSCVAACLVGGLSKEPSGAVVYDGDKCIGCRYCMLACPYHIPRYEWGRTVPYMRKCNLCFERLAKGETPACVDACPYQALVFGRREDLLARARCLQKENPGGYLPTVWGESALGGTSVLYISDVDLCGVGWPPERSGAIPSITDPLIEKTPLLGLTVGLGLWGVSAIIQRRRRLMAGDGEGEASSDREEGRGGSHS